MYPAYMLTLYSWFVRLIYMLALCITFGGIFPIMYWFALLECILCYKATRPISHPYPYPHPTPNPLFPPSGGPL